MIGGAPVGDEGSLAARLDEGHDARRPACPAHEVDPHAGLRQGCAEPPPPLVAADGADEGGLAAEPRDPARGVRRRAALAEDDRTGGIAGVGQRLLRGRHDVHHQVAQGDDPKAGPGAPGGGAGRPANGPRLGLHVRDYHRLDP
jgi:hypothetical protein